MWCKVPRRVLEGGTSFKLRLSQSGSMRKGRGLTSDDSRVGDGARNRVDQVTGLHPRVTELGCHSNSGIPGVVLGGGCVYPQRR